MTATMTEIENAGELLQRLGGISPFRVRMKPPPGTATERDLLEILNRTNVICELIDGVLVEKAMGYTEGNLALWLGTLLNMYLMQNDIGTLGGADSTIRLAPGLVRIPDVSFARWEKFPEGRLPREPIPDLVPDLAIEILSQGNTREEMELKLQHYFQAGVELVWLVDPARREVRVFTTSDISTTLTETDTLDGGSVLPGFSVAVARIFERLPDP
jgi:Uma2 family endonuclease